MQTYSKNSRFFAIILAFALIVINFPLTASADWSQAAAVGYLKSKPLDEWSIMALASSNSLSGVNLDFLKADPGNKPTDIEKRILAIIAAGVDPETFGQVNLVQKLVSLFNGTEINSTLAPNLLNDDIFGLLALAAADKNLEVRNQLASFIKQNQNSDGGWSYAYKGSPSDSNDTAMAIMALLANAEGSNSTAVSSGLNYLATTKTSTGYSFDAVSGYGPDAASSAWAISALLSGARPVSTAVVDYLKSLQQSDGSFAWQSGTAGSALMTAYVVIALNNDFYPVTAAGNGGGNPAQFQVWIKGPTNTVFQGPLAFNQFSLADSSGQTHTFNGPATIGTVSEAARIGSFTYLIRNTTLGLFVECIASICSSGTSGWMYAVNGTKPSLGAAQYFLSENDTVIWFFGQPNDPVPSWPASSSSASASVNLSANILPAAAIAPSVTLAASKTQINLGEIIALTWSSQNAGFVISSSPQGWAGTALSGSKNVQPSQTTTYLITVGSCPVGFTWNGHLDTSQNPALPICLSGSMTVLGAVASASVSISVNQQPSIVFGIDTANVNFGDLKAGQISPARSVRLTNSGSVNLRISTTLQNADSVYQQGLVLDNTLWSSFETNLDANFAKYVNLVLQISSNSAATGQKTGTLIFWASPR